VRRKMAGLFKSGPLAAPTVAIPKARTKGVVFLVDPERAQAQSYR
jgi:hypothetical protein